jgi:hypothetical protein
MGLRLGLLVVCAACAEPAVERDRAIEQVRTPTTGRLACFHQEFAYEPRSGTLDCMVAYWDRKETMQWPVPECDQGQNTDCFRVVPNAVDCAGNDGLNVLGVTVSGADHLLFTCW